MRKLLNTLYVTSDDVYLSVDGENIVAKRQEEIVGRYPMHNIQSVVSFSYKGASPILLGACANKGISFAFCTPSGKFLARINGKNNGNVFLRRTQYRIADDAEKSCLIAKNMIYGKLYNSAKSLDRTIRDYPMRTDVSKLKISSDKIKDLAKDAILVKSLDSLRGIEGVGAASYFGVFNELILNNKDVFFFTERSRRPPLDELNALLSFGYMLLTHECASALESVGLDAYVGFLHTDRPGRASLALDIMEELRPCMCDRFVLTLINNRIVNKDDFNKREDGAVLLNEQGRKMFLKHWQEKKKEELKHPYLNEKMQWGMIPYIQAMLLARYMREDLEEYPPFLWR